MYLPTFYDFMGITVMKGYKLNSFKIKFRYFFRFFKTMRGKNCHFLAKNLINIFIPGQITPKIWLLDMGYVYIF